MQKTHEDGVITFTAGGTVALGDIVKFSSGKVIKTTAVADVAIGVALDSAAADEIVPVKILGSGGTVTVKAAGAISQGAKVDPMGATIGSGSHYVGVALEAASASGDYIEVAHCACV